MKDPLFAAITYVLAALLILILILYIPRLVAWTGVFAKYPHLKNEKRNRIAVLVPARNEGDAVKPLLDTLAHQTYSDFEVFLIVKDPNDPNIKVAEDLGFHAHVEKNQKCKSDALDGVLQKILSEGRERFDAYLILDADTMIKENYLEEMNNALASGRDVVVSRKIVKNYFMGDGALSIQGTANGYIWTVFDDMGNKWKSLHGISLFTIGTGVMISKKIMLHNNGWPYHATLTEDCEFAADIIANHWTTYFAPYAPIYMEEAPTLRMTNMRRNRWVPGLIATYRLYFRKVVTFGNFWDVYFSYSMCWAFMYFGLLFLGFFVYGII
jgi:cellulose synthase/poly-beta-1,6-N-acetylglucosamine synthase-like glycosyltransferase